MTSSREKRDKRQTLWVIAGIVVIAIIATWGLIGGSWPWFTEAINAGPDPSIERGVTEGGYHYLGDPNAPVKLVVYEDYACPNCKRFFDLNEETLISDYIATGDVVMEMHPIAIISANSLPAAQAVYCADEQGAFWEYRELTFLNQGNLAFKRDNFGLIAETLGLDRAQFMSCFDAGGYETEIMQASQAAQNFGVEGTPTFIIAGERFPKAGETELPDVLSILDQKIAEVKSNNE